MELVMDRITQDAREKTHGKEFIPNVKIEQKSAIQKIEKCKDGRTPKQTLFFAAEHKIEHPKINPQQNMETEHSLVRKSTTKKYA